MAYGRYKILQRKTASGEALHNKALNVAPNPNFDVYKKIKKKNLAKNLGILLLTQELEFVMQFLRINKW